MVSPLDDLLELLEMLRVERDKILSDERLYYPPADVFVNAPLALIQCSMESRLWLVQRLLGEKVGTPKTMPARLKKRPL